MCEKQLTLGSLFDGSGGFPLAGLLNGIRPVWASEVAPFPILVTAKRLPEVKHYGDISTLNGAELEPVDIITFGSPCTSLSVAGLRAGLEGKQSVLFFQAIRIIKEMREQTHGRYPRWICWENVFGVFSSGQGHDFQRVLEEIIGIVVPQATVPAPDGYRWPYADVYVGDGWSLVYRTLNAQWYGVPQRRRRCYLVADFGSERACDILFERDGVRRDFTQGFRAWENPAGNSTVGVGTPEPGTESVYCLNDQNITEDVSENRTLTLKAHSNGTSPACFIPQASVPSIPQTAEASGMRRKSARRFAPAWCPPRCCQPPLASVPATAKGCFQTTLTAVFTKPRHLAHWTVAVGTPPETRAGWRWSPSRAP